MAIQQERVGTATHAIIPERLLSKRAVADILGVHEQTIMRLVRESKFPKPLRTGEKGSAVRWRTNDVADWINHRAGTAV